VDSQLLAAAVLFMICTYHPVVNAGDILAAKMQKLVSHKALESFFLTVMYSVADC